MGTEQRGEHLYSPEVEKILQGQFREPTRLERIKTDLMVALCIIFSVGGCSVLAISAEKSVGLPETIIGGTALTGAGVAAFLGLNRILARIDERRLKEPRH